MVMTRHPGEVNHQQPWESRAQPDLSPGSSEGLTGGVTRMRGRGWGMRQFPDASPQPSLRGTNNAVGSWGPQTPGRVSILD